MGTDRGPFQGRGAGPLRPADGVFGWAEAPICNVYIRRTNHVTFSDLNLIVRIPDSQLMDIRRAHRIINDYTVAFFDRYLNDAESSLVDSETPSPYDEVTVASRNVTIQRTAARRDEVPTGRRTADDFH